MWSNIAAGHKKRYKKAHPANSEYASKKSLIKINEPIPENICYRKIKCCCPQEMSCNIKNVSARIAALWANNF